MCNKVVPAYEVQNMHEHPPDIMALMRENPEAMNMPGGLLTTQGPQQYVGAVPAIAATLFFSDAHLPEVRAAICDCFDAYLVAATPQLTWLLRESPSEGPDRMAFAQAAPLKKMLATMDEDDALSFRYTSGKAVHDAGPWEFQVTGIPAWRANVGGWGLCGLRFSVPLLFVEEHLDAFRELFVTCADALHAAHGYAGHALVLSALRSEENQSFEAYLTSKMRGFDAGGLVSGAVNAHLGIKTISWLTAIKREYLEQVGGESTLRSALPMDWFGLYHYNEGIVIQSGPQPEAAPIDAPLPARLVLPDMLLQPIRTPQVRLHYASAESEPRLIGKSAEQWLTRLDVPQELLLAVKAQLLSEPKLPQRGRSHTFGI